MPKLKVPRDILVGKHVHLTQDIEVLLERYTKETGAVVKKINVFASGDKYAITIEEDSFDA